MDDRQLGASSEPAASKSCSRHTVSVKARH